MPAIRHAARPAKRRLVSFLLTSAALVSSAPAFAQAAEAEAEGDMIVVTGVRPIAESEAAALDAQRRAGFGRSGVRC
jgi:hypothetical protein